MDSARNKKPPVQPSIRSFFQPRQPNYVAPPSAPTPKSPASQPAVSTTTTIELRPTTLSTPPAPAASLTTTTTTQQAQATPVPQCLPTIPNLPPPPSLPPQASIVPVLEHHIPALRRINSLLLPVNYPDSFYSRILSPQVSGLFSRVILWRDEPDSELKVVGGLVCRLEPSPFADANGNPPRIAPNVQKATPPQSGAKPPEQDSCTPNGAIAGPHAIYIQSLALLSPYRSLGLAAAALENVANSAAVLRQTPAGPGLPPSVNARTVYAHVWTENQDGLRWYEARGFARQGSAPVGGYYFRLRPDTAWVVRRDLGNLVGEGAEGRPGAVMTSSSSFSSSQVAAAAQISSPPPSQAASSPPPPPPSTVAAAVNLPPPSSAQVPTPPTTTPSPAPSLSFQNARPDREWNDLPLEMMGVGPPPGRSAHLSAPGSGASSRSSSSTARKKKDRSYPAAAFGS